MGTLRERFRRIADEVAELPGMRVLAEPIYRREFARRRRINSYYGVYPTRADAEAHVPRSSPGTYDIEDAGSMYDYRLATLQNFDYPALFWFARLLEMGQRRIFDLGGHVGLSYYAFQQYVTFPEGLRWQVHDVPSVMRHGRALAAERDDKHMLDFVDLDAGAGSDVLMAKGSLQYLDYTLSDLLQRQRPAHVLINLTPMHPNRSFFTLQNIGVAICPYRITALPAFLAEVRSQGYRLVERWDHPERTVHVPFHPECFVDRYYGFYFRREQ